MSGAAGPLGIRFVAGGFRPFGSLDDVPWLPKRRYDIMREYLPRHGRLAHEMMKRTATVQVNLDFADEADAVDKIRTAMGVTSIVTALYASSPIGEGKPNGHLSYRAAVWLEMDEDRCGLLPFVFEPGFGFARYAEWALDVPMFFVARRGQYHPQDGLTFRRFLREGWQGERATLADWELHLSTVFPEVRLKRTIECRGRRRQLRTDGRGAGRRCGGGCCTTPGAGGGLGAGDATPASTSGSACAGTCRAPVWRRGWATGPSRRWRWSCVGSRRLVWRGFLRAARTRPCSSRCWSGPAAGRVPADDMLADFQRLGGDPAKPGGRLGDGARPRAPIPAAAGDSPAAGAVSI